MVFPCCYISINLLYLMFYVPFCTRFTLSDLTNEGYFQVSASLDICYNANGDCHTSFEILQDARIRKPLCDMNTTFVHPGIANLTNLTDSKTLKKVLKIWRYILF